MNSIFHGTLLLIDIKGCIQKVQTMVAQERKRCRQFYIHCYVTVGLTEENKKHRYVSILNTIVTQVSYHNLWILKEMHSRIITIPRSWQFSITALPSSQESISYFPWRI